MKSSYCKYFNQLFDQRQLEERRSFEDFFEMCQVSQGNIRRNAKNEKRGTEKEAKQREIDE